MHGIFHRFSFLPLLPFMPWSCSGECIHSALIGAVVLAYTRRGHTAVMSREPFKDTGTPFAPVRSFVSFVSWRLLQYGVDKVPPLLELGVFGARGACLFGGGGGTNFVRFA